MVNDLNNISTTLVVRKRLLWPSEHRLTNISNWAGLRNHRHLNPS